MPPGVVPMTPEERAIFEEQMRKRRAAREVEDAAEAAEEAAEKEARRQARLYQLSLTVTKVELK
jgi:hypothetical protein